MTFFFFSFLLANLFFFFFFFFTLGHFGGWGGGANFLLNINAPSSTVYTAMTIFRPVNINPLASIFLLRERERGVCGQCKCKRVKLDLN